MRIGLDLGGTKIEGVALGDDGAQLARRRVATPRARLRGDPRGDGRRSCATSRPRPAGRAASASGCRAPSPPPAASSRTRTPPGSSGSALDRDLSGLLGRPVRFANDANCFALSEAVDGAAAGARVVFGVIVGTGTGGGIVVDRTALTGRNAIAGEWGHNPLPWPRADEWPGPACYCGKTGCVETFLSGPGLARDFREATGEAVAAPEIVARAERGDEAASAALGRYEERMARALAVVLERRRPRRRRPGRGHVADRAPLRQRAAALAGVGVLRPGGHPAEAARARRLERRPRRGVALGSGEGGLRRGMASQPRRRSHRPDHRAPSADASRPASRAPASSGVCRDLDEVARRNGEISAWIARPILPLRVVVGLLVVLILAGHRRDRRLPPPRGPPALLQRARPDPRGRRQRRRLRRGRHLLPGHDRDPRQAPPRAPGDPRAALDRPRDRHAPAHQGPGDGRPPRDRRPASCPPRSPDPLRAVALPRLLQRGALAHRQGRRALRPGLRRSRWRSRP